MLTVLSTLTFSEPAHAFNPQTQTVEGTSVTIVDARWEDEELFKSTFRRYAPRPGNKLLVVWYDVTPDPVRRIGTRSYPINTVNLSLHTSDGLDIIGQPTYDANILPGHRTAMFMDVDPRTKAYELNLKVPAIPSLTPVSDPSPERVTFTQIPVPPSDYKAPATILTMTQTSAGGVRVVLDKIAIRPGRGQAGGESKVSIVGHWVPPLSTPDMIASLQMARAVYNPFAVEPTIDAKPATTLIRPQLTLTDTIDDTNRRMGRFSIEGSLPSADTQLVSVAIDLSCKSPSQIDQTQYRSFTFPLKCTDILMPPVTPQSQPNPVLRQMMTDGSTITIRKIDVTWTRSYGLVYRGDIIIDTPNLISNGEQWINDEMSWSLPGGGSGRTGSGGSGPYWTDDGAPIANDQSHFYLSMSIDRAAASQTIRTLSAVTRWTRTRTDRYAASFPNVPIPLPGSIQPINTTVRAHSRDNRAQDASAAGYYTLRKIGSFDEDHLLTPNIAIMSNLMMPPCGVAAVVQHTDLPPGPSVTGSMPETLRITLVKAQDDMGRSLLRKPQPWRPSDLRPLDDLALGSAVTAAVNLYFYPPTLGAKLLSFDLDIDREVAIAKTKAEFPNIPLPEPPSGPTD
ncbi:MAG TPA: hypothetical protein VGK19_05710 [Capsulimonadaceae bacterium]|jgi:hypothetical protein